MQQGYWHSCWSSSIFYKMSRSLDEAHTWAFISASSGGVVSFVSLPTPQLEVSQRWPRLPTKSHDQIIPKPLCPAILSTDQFTHWLTLWHNQTGWHSTFLPNPLYHLPQNFNCQLCLAFYIKLIFSWAYQIHKVLWQLQHIRRGMYAHIRISSFNVYHS